MNNIELVSTHLCMTKDIGVAHNLFGGYMMCWLDEAGAIYARGVTNEENVVTIKFEEIVFKQPVKVRDIIKIYCGDPVIGESSVTFTIMAKVRGKIVCQTKCVFVAVTSLGYKKRIECPRFPREDKDEKTV